MKKSLEPRWNQTFMYSPVHRREFRERMLELTVWDQARVREEESQFLGEVRTFSCVNTRQCGSGVLGVKLVLLLKHELLYFITDHKVKLHVRCH